MNEEELALIKQAIADQEKSLQGIQEGLLNHKAYIHALEAIVLQLMAQTPINQRATLEGLASWLRNAPETEKKAARRITQLLEMRFRHGSQN